MSELITVAGVRGYIDEHGVAQLNLEDVARGLGFTQVKGSMEYVRWETIEGYLKGFRFSQQVGKEGFVPENIFYRLAMKAKNAVAEEFQSIVADEILPSIRKTGSYGSSIDVSKLSPELQMFKATFDAVAKIQIEAAEANQKIIEVQTKVTTIQETILQRDDNWRQKITGMLNGAAQRFGGHQEIRKESYSRLEERAHCKLNTRLANLKDRLEESGATKTKIEKANRLDVIEADPKLKEIYSTIVKELSIGALL
ncbi:BRO family protein [Paenibacillus xylanexedens]|uniref:Prophage antirepressor-like protein n=1 Tax=Paenibacillus xylanexedens TaxID=528191 RepID=A0ABS4RR31_PAEXY|nr:BRO family protein [Paenibacillus xylanexedens]MBP2245337.1 prophage antirepressor-like protein [Paenibacillus xylanexedens]